MKDAPRPESPAPRGGARRPLLGDVAAAAGVSVVTVSRAMNAPGIVSAKTHARIEAAIAATGYVPDLVARSMAQRRTRIVAGFVPSLRDSIFADTTQGLSDELTRSGLQLLLGNTQYDPAREHELVAAMLGRRPDAIALTGAAHAPALRRLLREARIPVVEMWSLGGRPIDLAVGLSNRQAARVAAAHLVARGYRRIGFVGRPVAGNDRARDRQSGYRDALRDAGLPAPPEWVWETDTTLEAGRAALDRLALPHRLDALLFSGDNTAAGALLACLERRISVPGRLAICGFGDLPIARALPGGLTTIRVDSYGIGARAGGLLVHALADARPRPRRIDVGFELVPRGST
jgi:LacI family gluconate utilization system Gnt-I transcriptional repressor